VLKLWHDRAAGACARFAVGRLAGTGVLVFVLFFAVAVSSTDGRQLPRRGRSDLIVHPIHHQLLTDATQQSDVSPIRAVSADDESPIDLSIVKDLSSELIPGLEAKCGAPPTGWGLQPTGTMSIEFLHSSTGSLLDYHGEIGALIEAHDFGFNLTVPAGVSCELTVPLDPVTRVLKYRGLEIPVDAHLGWKTTIATSQETQMHIQASFAIKVEMKIDGRHVDTYSNATGSAGGSTIKGGGVTVTTGPVGGVGIDLEGHRFNVKAGIEGYFHLTAKAPPSGGCEVGAGAESSISAQSHIPALGVKGEFSWKREASATFYHCSPVSQPSKPAGEPESGGEPGPGECWIPQSFEGDVLGYCSVRGETIRVYVGLLNQLELAQVHPNCHHPDRDRHINWGDGSPEESAESGMLIHKFPVPHGEAPVYYVRITTLCGGTAAAEYPVEVLPGGPI
jgi:hypothetical protein